MSVGEIYSGARRSVFTVEGREPGLDEWPEGPPRLDDGVATGTGFAIAGDASSPTSTWWPEPSS